jgi:hypothetical protein
MGLMDDGGAKLLAPLRNVHPHDESGVDVARAMRTGKRHQRNRVVTGVMAVVGLAVLAMVVVPSAVRHQAIAPAVPTVSEFDMFKQAMQVGTAGGFEPYNYRTGRFEQAVDVVHTPGGRGYGRVTIYAPGHHKPVDTSKPAVDVNGLPAFWQPGEKDPTLAVNWTDNGWAVIRATSDTDLDIVERTHRLAQAITFNGATSRAVVPFTLPARLPGDPLRLVGLMQNRDWMSGQVLLSTSDETGAPVLAVNVGWGFPVDKEPNSSINGHEAIVEDKSFTILNADGNGAVVSVRYDDVGQLGGIEALRVLAASVEPVAEHANHTAWKADPWR